MRWVSVWCSEVISSYISEIMTFWIHVISMWVVSMLVVIVFMSMGTHMGIEIKRVLNEFPWMIVMWRSEVIMLLVDKVLTISVHIICMCVMSCLMIEVMKIPLVISMVWCKVRIMFLRFLDKLFVSKIMMSSVITWLHASVVVAILVHVICIVVMGCIMIWMISAIVRSSVLIVVLWRFMHMPV